VKKGQYQTTYCNRLHRLSDGKPIRHECYVMPTEALHAEKAGDIPRANVVMSGWKKKRAHKGVGS
jgi:hypothetical protein